MLHVNLRTGSRDGLLGLLDAVDGVVHSQLVGLAFGHRGGFAETDGVGSACRPSPQAGAPGP